MANSKDEKIPKKSLRTEETFLFVFLITAVGGFINTYSYFVCGGVFASANTGNMIQMGMAIHADDWQHFVACLVPTLASIIGSAMARIVWHINKEKSHVISSDVFILVEIFILFVIAFLPDSVPNNYINVVLALVCGYQIGTFRSFNGTPHNTTNCAGNLRTMGYFVGDTIASKFSKESMIQTGKYFIVLISFTIGAYIGTLTSNLWGKYASFVGCFMLAIMIVILNVREHFYERANNNV